MVGVAATIVMSATNRRVFADPQGRHANLYVTLLRYGVLTLLGAITVLVALRAYAPDAVPNRNADPDRHAPDHRDCVERCDARKVETRWRARIAAALDVSKPPRLGKAHRLMGRVLFFGGLIALVASPFVHYAATFVAIGGIVIVGVTAAAIESWRVWRAQSRNGDFQTVKIVAFAFAHTKVLNDK